MGTLRSLAVTADRARGFLKHRDTENTERKNEGEEERREEERWREKRVGNQTVGKKSGGKEEYGEPLSLWVGVVVRMDGRNSRWGRRCGATKSLRQYDR
jgi:hypothetical protein